jgi:hypothetical protein
MNQGHNQSPNLNLCVALFVAKQVKEGEYEQRPKILDIEYIIPSDLFSKVLQSKLGLLRDIQQLKREVIVGERYFFITKFIG